MPDCCIDIMVPNSAASFLAVLGTVMAGKIPVMIQQGGLKIAPMQRGNAPIAVPTEFAYFDALPKMGSGKPDFRRITKMVMKEDEL
jgi:hypothetical protein